MYSMYVCTVCMYILTPNSRRGRFRLENSQAQLEYIKAPEVRGKRPHEHTTGLDSPLPFAAVEVVPLADT